MDKKTVRPIIAVVNDWGSVCRALDDHDAYVLELDLMKDVSRAMKYVDGIVLTGGGDIDPERYGAKRHSRVYGVNPARDKLEFTVAKLARRRRVNMMGICRGHQLLNVVHGGTLIQHLGDLKYSHTHAVGSHDVKLRRYSRVGRRLGVVNLDRATTLHHQAIDRLGNGLVPVGWAEDGTIEMIESVEGIRPYVLGCQFHPELDYAADEDARNIFAHFVEVCRESAKGKARDRSGKVEDLKYKRHRTYTYGDWGYGSDSGKMWDTTTKRWVEDVPMHRSGLTRTYDESEIYYGSDHFEDDGMSDPEEIAAYISRQNANARELQSRTAADLMCEFPPCATPEDCLMWGDCASTAVARQAAFREKYPNLSGALVAQHILNPSDDEWEAEVAKAKKAKADRVSRAPRESKQYRNRTRRRRG